MTVPSREQQRFRVASVVMRPGPIETKIEGTLIPLLPDDTAQYFLDRLARTDGDVWLLVPSGEAVAAIRVKPIVRIQADN